MKSNDDLKSVYKYLNNLITHSSSYSDLIYLLTTDKKIVAKIKELLKNDVSLFNDLIKDVGFIHELSLALGKEEKFTKCVINAVKKDNAVETIINTKFIETFYGNSLKEDVSLNDVMFLILESIIGLDTIIKSFSENDKIVSRINAVMSEKEGDFNSLNNLINKIYNSLIKCKSYDEIVDELAKYRNELVNYIQGGMDFQLYEIMNDPNGNYENYDLLLSRLGELMIKINAKIM